MKPIVRTKEELFTSTVTRAYEEESYDVVINGPTYKVTNIGKIDAFNGNDSVPAEETLPEGQVIHEGLVLTGSKSDMFYLSYDKNAEVKYRMGRGYAQRQKTASIGNFGPIIIEGLKYGRMNKYDPPNPEAKKKGPPNKENKQYLIQRSNTRYGQLENAPNPIGKIAVVISNKYNLLFVLAQKHNSPGVSLNKFKEICLFLDAYSAGYLDGSDSVMLTVNGTPILKQANNKNEANIVGIGFKYS